MQKQIHLVLGEIDVLKILDGLEVREEAWRKTAAFLQTEEFPEGEDFVVEECSSAHEAHAIANTYARIIETIRKQQTAQSASEKSGDRKMPSKDNVESAYAIYIDTFFGGPQPVER